MLLPEEKERPPFTWALLKDFCNSLSNEQLQQEVIVPQDESSIRILYASDLGEDQYHFIDFEMTVTKADYDPRDFDGKTWDEALETEEYVLVPGTNIYLFDE